MSELFMLLLGIGLGWALRFVTSYPTRGVVIRGNGNSVNQDERTNRDDFV